MKVKERNLIVLFIVLIGVIFQLSGCVTHTTLQLGAINYEQGNVIMAGEPPLHEKVTKNIGDIIISSFPAIQRPAVQLQKDFQHAGYNLGKDFTLFLPGGKYFLEGEDYRGKFYQYSSPLKFSSGRNITSVIGGLVIPDDQDLPHQIYWIPTDQLGSRISDPTIGFSVTESFYEERVKDELKQVLVYSGVSGGQIKFTYKEFMNDLARPAFYQEVSYDLMLGETIGFKKARFKVLEANSTSITYEVQERL